MVSIEGPTAFEPRHSQNHLVRRDVCAEDYPPACGDAPKGLIGGPVVRSTLAIDDVVGLLIDGDVAHLPT